MKTMIAATAALLLATPVLAMDHAHAEGDKAGYDAAAVAMPATVVDIAVGSPDHTTLVALVTQAGLVEALSATDGEFTVFAPVNAAFEALPADVSAAVTSDNALLTSVLTYHVVPGKIKAADLVDGMEVTTLNGATFTVSLADGVKVNGASVVAADLEAGNGVVHVIDGVLVPPAAE